MVAREGMDEASLVSGEGTTPTPTKPGHFVLPQETAWGY
jgi:hypothetical protein